MWEDYASLGSDGILRSEPSAAFATSDLDGGQTAPLHEGGDWAHRIDSFARDNRFNFQEHGVFMLCADGWRYLEYDRCYSISPAQDTSSQVQWPQDEQVVAAARAAGLCLDDIGEHVMPAEQEDIGWCHK